MPSNDPAPEPAPKPEGRPNDREAEHLDDDSLGELLDPLPELSSDEADAETSQDELESSDFLDVPPSASDDDAEGPLDLGDAEDGIVLPASDPTGDEPEGLDAFDDLEPPPDFGSGDDSSGLDDPWGGVPPVELPRLEPDEGDFEEAIELPRAALVADEPRPPAADKLWTDRFSVLTLEPCSALCCAQGVIVAASSDLFWFSPGERAPVRLGAGSSSIHDVVLVGPAWDQALFSTVAGRLFRRGRSASVSVELRGASDAPGTAKGREPLHLCQPTRAHPTSILARTEAGALLLSQDGGGVFQRVETDRVVALSPAAEPSVALTRNQLLTSDDGGSTFRRTELDQVGRAFAEALAPRVAAAADVVALSDPELGLAISSDGGKTFARVSGTLGAGAVAVGPVSGRVMVLAALNDQAGVESTVLGVEPAGLLAETLFRVEIVPQDDDDPGAGTRIARLAWEPLGSTLWMAGAFGVRALVQGAVTGDLADEPGTD